MTDRAVHCRDCLVTVLHLKEIDGRLFSCSRAALAIDAAFGGDDPRVRSATQALASMPHWSEQRRFDLWEEHVEQVVPVTDQSSLPMRLVEEVFEFGRFNFYGAFQAEETAHEFRRLVARLSQHGVMLNEHQDVSEW